MTATVKKVNLNPEKYCVVLPDCFTRIAEIAYYKAESRGFVAGHELEDWFEAEQEFTLKFREQATKQKPAKVLQRY
ncbi:MAG: DUF2934 domain-containing protein [Methylococcaceae bacterium]